MTEQAIHNTAAKAFLDCVGPLVVINLPYRNDRRAEFAQQLHRIGLSFDMPQVQIFDAIRPDATDGFPTIGTRGCFLSHLGVLRRAQAAGWDSVLICEDDLDFTPGALARLPRITDALQTLPWSIFYGGYGDPPPGAPVASDLVLAPPGHGIVCAHFYAVRGEAIAKLVRFLEAILARPPGHIDGGPMHYDGALSRFRTDHPQHETLAAIPPIGVQRPSRTDIHALRWFDRAPLLRDIVSVLRRVRAARMRP